MSDHMERSRSGADAMTARKPDPRVERWARREMKHSGVWDWNDCSPLVRSVYMESARRIVRAIDRAAREERKALSAALSPHFDYLSRGGVPCGSSPESKGKHVEALRAILGERTRT